MHVYHHQSLPTVAPDTLRPYIEGLRRTKQAILALDQAQTNRDWFRKKQRDTPQNIAQRTALYLKNHDTDPDTHMYASLLHVVPNMLMGKRTLKFGSRYGQQHYHAKMQLIEFNDVIRSIADTHPSLEPDILTAIVQAVVREYGYPEGAVNAAGHETHNAARGIRHELGVEQELRWLPDDYQVLPTDDDDDKNGADYRVLYRPTNTIVDIDVKASEETAHNAILDEEEFQQSKGHGYAVPRGKLILYSGFADEDFDPLQPWHVTPQAVQREIPRVKALIQQAAKNTTVVAA